MGLRIGVDLGGTKIEALVLGADGAELARRRVPTPQGDYRGTIEAIASLVESLERESGGRASVGLGTPGSLSPATGMLRNSNSVCLNGMPFRQDLEARLGRAVRIANDADCFALSEATDGAGRGAATVFGVILGTGVGGGVVVNGSLLTGASGIAGEWGHNPLPGLSAEDGPARRCWCGRGNCQEVWLSGRALAAEYRASGGQGNLEAAQLDAAARAGDGIAEAVLARFERRLARALAVVINLIDPQVIVLGGGLSNLDRLYESVPRLWVPHVFSDVIATRLARNVHGDSSGVRGAAWLWSEA